MTMVYLPFSCWISSSTFEVAIGIERGARFIHEDDAGLDGDGAGDAQALLLAAGKPQPAGVQAVLHFVPQRGAAQALLDDFIELLAVVDALDLQPVGDVLVDRFGKRIRLLKDHADLAAQRDHIHIRVMNIDAVDANRPARRCARCRRGRSCD